VDRELRNEALTDLCARVDDWKNHRVDHFGELLLHGHFPVVTGKTDVQKEVGSPSFLATKNFLFGDIEAVVCFKCKALYPFYISGKAIYSELKPMLTP